MSVTATISRSYKDASNVALAFSETVTDDTQLPFFDGTIAIAANVELFITCTVANLKAFMIKTDQAITVYTNNPSGSTPQDTIPLVAGQCYVWTRQTDGVGKIPFSGNVTAIYITNASPAIANVSIRGITHQHS